MNFLPLYILLEKIIFLVIKKYYIKTNLFLKKFVR